MSVAEPAPARLALAPSAGPAILPAHLLAVRSAKVRDHHLDRKAIVYIRQSSPQQVAEHKELTRRVCLADVAVGWAGLAIASRSSTLTRAHGTDGRGAPRLPVHPRGTRA